MPTLRIDSSSTPIGSLSNSTRGLCGLGNNSFVGTSLTDEPCLTAGCARFAILKISNYQFTRFSPIVRKSGDLPLNDDLPRPKSDPQLQCFAAKPITHQKRYVALR